MSVESIKLWLDCQDYQKTDRKCYACECKADKIK